MEGFTTLSILACTHILKRSKYQPHAVMPCFKLNGKQCVEACLEIKSRYSHLPVVALSRNSDIKEIYSRLGFDDRIPKPFDLAHLFAILRKYLPAQTGAVYSKRISAIKKWI